MKIADYTDKNRIIEILAKSFDTNQSVNYIVQQDEKRSGRIRALMDYSFEVCYAFGKVFLSEDRSACALILFPDQKRTTPKSIWLDIKLILSCVGLGNINKALARESKIKKLQPDKSMYYLWFIGVDPAHQHSGVGTRLLDEVIEDSKHEKKPIYLETSTLANLPWYKKFGFTQYDELDLGYKLFFLKRALNH